MKMIGFMLPSAYSERPSATLFTGISSAYLREAKLFIDFHSTFTDKKGKKFGRKDNTDAYISVIKITTASPISTFF